MFYLIIIRSTGKIKTPNKGIVFCGGLEVSRCELTCLINRNHQHIFN